MLYRVEYKLQMEMFLQFYNFFSLFLTLEPSPVPNFKSLLQITEVLELKNIFTVGRVSQPTYYTQKLH